MSSIDAVAVALLSRLDALLEDSIAPAVSGGAAAHVSTQGETVPDQASAPTARPAVPEQMSLSELAMVLDAIAGPAQAAPPAVAGQAPLLPAAPFGNALAMPGASASFPSAPAPQLRATPAGAVDAATVSSTVQTLSAALARTVNQSGLFYESHLADWLTGQRTLAELAHEPQAGLAADPQSPAALQNSATGIAPAALPLVRQQLDLLATGQFRWTGEVWPGAHLDWTIEPDQHHAGTSEASAPPSWRTRITLSLPQLGPVEADLRLSGADLAAHLRAGETGAQRMQAHAGEFAQRLASAGLQLARLSVQRDPEAR